jgi:hypothetical protein
MEVLFLLLVKWNYISFSSCGEFCHKFFVVNSLCYKVILGLDFLATNKIFFLTVKTEKLITTAAPVNSLEVEKPSSLITEILKSNRPFETGSTKVQACAIRLQEGFNPVRVPLRKTAQKERID